MCWQEEDLAKNVYPKAKIEAANAAKHTTLAAKFCTPEIWEKYKDKKSSGKAVRDRDRGRGGVGGEYGRPSRRKCECELQAYAREDRAIKSDLSSHWIRYSGHTTHVRYGHRQCGEVI